MKHIASLAALLALSAPLVFRDVSPGPFIYDEADYMYAARLGYRANYTDSPTLPFKDFLHIGLSRGKASGAQESLSELIRASNDIVFYRHWHGPLYHDFLIPVSRLGLSEEATRRSMLFASGLTLMAIYLGCVWLIPGLLGMAAGWLSSILFLTSATVTGSGELAPHQLFAFFYICSLILLAKSVVTGQRRYWYGAVAAAGLAMCTLEIAFALVITLVICAFIERDRLKVGWRFAIQSIAVLVAVVLVIWPAAIWKLSFLKAYFFMAYLALMRASPWGNIGFTDTWRARLAASPIEWAAVAAGVILYFRARQANRAAYPILLYSALAIAATLRVFATAPRYALPFMPALDLFAGLTLVVFLRKLPRPAGIAIGAALAAALYGMAQYRTSQHVPSPDAHAVAELQYIRQHHLEDKPLIAPHDDIPMIHYYYPAARLRGYYGARPTGSDLEGFMAGAVFFAGYPLQAKPASAALN